MSGVEELIRNSVVVINKPPGQTSHETTTFVKKITGANRSGHAGTLDPEVSGVLPVALGRATKLLRYIAGKEKSYVGIMKFKVVPAKADVEALFKQFTGELVQTPPKISAVRKVARKRTVYSLRLLELDGRLALFDTRVDAGTYIRALCVDMGKKCEGARMEELRRTAVGKITEKEAHTMEELIDAVWLYRNKNDGSALEKMLLPPERFIDLPKVMVKETALWSINTGAQVMAAGVERMDDGIAKDARVAIYSDGKFVGVGIAQISSDELPGKERGMVVRLERVHKSG
ncbi:RNA-guided pseudouridylation complex pseudouridine synthase subunit Cbf5 [Candidatus Micrarchaeota archaeon]|nr:RNA-guided pseudouridylation complex pseudouridine synthase subunit Cbf5 [Candidatus Micrarchaeota archaeon]